METDQYISGLLEQVKSLIGDESTTNSPKTNQPVVGNTTGNYVAPIHGTWHSSGGFTYQPNSTHPRGHMGVDLRAPAGTAIYPLAPGIVTNVGTDPMGGNVINVQHANGIRTYYAHLSTARVHKGDKVDTNTVIGAVGNTGNASHTFPHLHFQVWKDNQIQNPASFFTVPKYTDLSPEEKKQGQWLSEKAKQEAANFNMKNHVANQRVAFSRNCEQLLKTADQYYKFSSQF